MTDDFHLRCQHLSALTSVFYPSNDAFSGMKNNNLTTNNVIAFDLIKI